MISTDVFARFVASGARNNGKTAWRGKCRHVPIRSGCAGRECTIINIVQRSVELKVDRSRVAVIWHQQREQQGRSETDRPQGIISRIHWHDIPSEPEIEPIT